MADATGNHIPRVQKFSPDGKFITKWGSYGSGDGQFIDPEHLAIDSNGYVYVSDRAKNNIQVFKPVDNIHPWYTSYDDNSILIISGSFIY